MDRRTILAGASAAEAYGFTIYLLFQAAILNIPTNGSTGQDLGDRSASVRNFEVWVMGNSSSGRHGARDRSEAGASPCRLPTVIGG
jgi:hypothetical protein